MLKQITALARLASSYSVLPPALRTKSASAIICAIFSGLFSTFIFLCLALRAKSLFSCSLKAPLIARNSRFFRLSSFKNASNSLGIIPSKSVFPVVSKTCFFCVFLEFFCVLPNSALSGANSEPKKYFFARFCLALYSFLSKKAP